MCFQNVRRVILVQMKNFETCLYPVEIFEILSVCNKLTFRMTRQHFQDRFVIGTPEKCYTREPRSQIIANICGNTVSIFEISSLQYIRLWCACIQFSLVALVLTCAHGLTNTVRHRSIVRSSSYAQLHKNVTIRPVSLIAEDDSAFTWLTDWFT